MPSSIAEREKLISGLSLLLIAGLFLVAFVLLRPSEKDFQLSAVEDPLTSVEPLGELELAYLRARVATGEQSPAEVSMAVSKMIRAQQYSAARRLLSDHPDVQINETDRFRLELETTATSHARDKAGNPLTAELSAQLQYLVNHPSLQTAETLLRASRLSHKLAEPGLSAHLYVALAQHDTGNAVYWYEQCETYANTATNMELAQSCLNSAIDKTVDAEKIFALKLRLLEKMAISGSAQVDSPGQLQGGDILVNELLAVPSLSAAQLESLAKTLLATERPKSAVGVFEELATIDTQQRVHWLNEAARWSVATSQNVRAVTLLDQTRAELDETAQADLDQRVETLLIAAGEQDSALKRTKKRLESLPDDIAELASGSVLAQQSGNLEQALTWNTRLLSLQPDNVAAVNRQVSLLLATGKLEGAYGWSHKAVAVQPDNLEVREQLARISEWTSRPYEAVEHWQSIDEATQSQRRSTREVVRLAELTLQPVIGARALQRGVAIAEPTDEETARLSRLYELDGKPHLAAGALEETMQQWGDTRFRLEQLATLHRRHINYESALLTWQRYQALVGATPKALLNQLEMHWRLGQSAQAVEISSRLEKLLDGAILPSDTSEYQLMVLSEIGWRYQQNRLTLLTRSRIHQLEKLSQRTLVGRRLVDVLVGLGQKDEAIREATTLWMETRETDFAIRAMALKFERGDSSYPDHFLDDTVLTRELHLKTRYWSLLAGMQLRNRDHNAAQKSYRRALALAPKDGEPLSGLLWLHIGRAEQEPIAQIVEYHREQAETEPQLWAAFAVAHLQLGNAAESLQWFALLGDSIDADYNLLLLYADALALADKADQALKMRRYALQKLRPLIAQETLSDKQTLLRQYARLLSYYGSAEEQEQLTTYLLSNRSFKTEDQTAARSLDSVFWREDMAIGWLMSTQRHEQARVIMAQIQQQRLATPEWQLLAMALRDKDRAAVESVLANVDGLGGVLSASDRVLALRTLGNEAKAQALLVNARQRASTPGVRTALADQYASIRQVRPGYAGSLVRSSDIKGLSIAEIGVSARHSFDLSELGISLEYVQRYLDSSRFLPGGRQEESDLAIALHFGGQQSGGYISTGFLSSETTERVYVNGLYFRTDDKRRNTYTLDIAYNETTQGSAQLRLGAVQHRAGVTLDTAMRNNQFLNFQASASQIQTRVSDKRFARGLQTRLEYGFRGSRGANNWSTSVVADTLQYDRADVLPEELRLASDSTLDEVLAKESTSLSIGASLDRGNVNGNFPQVSSPRYHLATRLGRTWPEDSYGLQLAAGAGVRLIGGDELSFGLSWEWLTESSRVARSNNTSFGLNYKYHF